MTTSTAQKFVSLFLSLVGGFILIQGLGMPYYGRFGPGSGFFAVWVGAPLLGLSLLLFIGTIFARPNAVAFLDGEGTWKRPVGLSLACLALLPALPLLGFRVTMFLFVLLVPRLLEKQKPVTAVVVAAAASFGIAHIFESLLHIRLPHSSLAFLTAIGL